MDYRSSKESLRTLAVLLFVSVASLSASALKFTAIDVPGSIATQIFGINNAGTIVGSYTTSTFVLKGFVRKGNTYTDVVYPGTTFDVATGINDSAEMVGYYADANGNDHGFLYKSGNFTVIDAPSAASTMAMGINNNGVIVGFYFDREGLSHAFELEHGKFTVINGPAAIRTAANKINNRGVIAGDYLDSNFRQHGFILANGTLKTVDYPLSNASTELNGIDDTELAVGDYATAQGNTGFAYHDGKFSAFSYPGSSFTFAEDVNNHFTIVGSYSDANNVSHGFMLNR